MIDLFCGCGGVSLGFKLAGCRIVGAVDNDPVVCGVYSENLNLEPICDDLRRVKGFQILEHYGLKKDGVDFVVGCPPCQGFSSLRQTRGLNGEDDRNDLIGVFLKRVHELKPRAVVFENVPGIIRVKGGKYLKQYLKGMRKMGYESVYEIVNAADYGVPQFRRRIVAFSVKPRKKKEKLQMPNPTHVNPKKAEKEGKLPWKSVRDAISDLPPLKPGEEHPSIPNHKARNHTPQILEIIRHVPKNGGSRKKLPKKLWLKCHKRLPDYKGAENIYGRMNWDVPSNTMTARCLTPSSGRFVHPEQDRGITPREAARLQTFPDTFVFPDHFAWTERCIGNAMPVNLVADLVKRFVQNHKHLL